ncbi:tyrosine-protein phosphatase [Spongiimicrobium salis]|uniref:tyrosine-protein phosphatase n=1 Tax=Spongiimicrobium salis TaxID=1667022 RepID=UPI00374DD0DF
MFHFFSKKKFLVDSLENLVDIHNHILPGIDDGAKTTDEAIALIKGFVEIGIRNFVATPHIMGDLYPNTSETIHKALNLVQSELLKHNIKDIAIEASAEHMIDVDFEKLLSDGEVLPLRKEFLLVEMSYLQPSLNFKEAIIKIAAKRFYPILAHPERYTFFHGHLSRYQRYKNKGISFQMNLLSLGDFYGKEVQKVAHKLLNEGLIDYVASDVHNLHQLNALKELAITPKTEQLLLPVINTTIETFY